MLEPITKKVTDESEGGTYRFTFYCDVCGSPWHSDTYSQITDPTDMDEDAGQRESDHNATFERANADMK